MHLAKELTILSTGTTQVAQKWPPKTFWTSKRWIFTSLDSAALQYVVGTARPSKMGWAPLNKQLEVPWICCACCLRTQSCPSWATSGTSWRGPRRETITPGPQPPRTLQPKLTSPRMGAKDLKPCEGNGNRQERSRKRPKVAKQPLPRAVIKGLLCRAGLARLRPA